MPTSAHKEWPAQLLAIVAKTDRYSEATLSLPAHLEDSMWVAWALWDTFIPAAIKQFLAEAIGSEDSARTMVGFLAGIHDVGKASDVFQRSLPSFATSHLGSHGLRLTSINQKAPHGTTGQLAVQAWFSDKVGSGPGSKALAEVIGGHHGLNPASSDLADVRRGLLLEDAVWAHVRSEILTVMMMRSGAGDLVAQWAKLDLPLPARTLLQAIVILADWIASNTDFFPYLDSRSSGVRAADALEALAFVPPWSPDPTGLDDAESLFSARFPRLAGQRPNEVQREAWRLASTVTSPCLMLIEARPGFGKTEAGLMAAELLSARFGRGGVFIGLPTMATANPMFMRMSEWLRTMREQVSSVNLAHGKAALNADFDRLVAASRTGQVYDDEAGSSAGLVRVVSWLRGRKRTLLANFVVGTVDQFLMGGLKAKHVVLRHLALAGKVVVIDEVHAADDYMREYALVMLEWLGRYGTPVILMSATLPPQQRADYVAAYAHGRGVAAAPDAGGLAYPRITVFDGDTSSTPIADPTPPVQLTVNRLEDDLGHLIDLLGTSLVNGGCAAVIRNTVGRAQETYLRIAEVFGDDVVLLHSRFIAPHRADREARLLGELGREGARPARRIVVGTQVLEQSLDVDFDVMVTDLAPIDLLLQRVGRLHRHHRDERPDGLRVPTVYIAGVDWTAVPPEPVRGSIAVYGRAKLLRALAVMQPALDAQGICVPDDIPAMVANGYDPSLSPPEDWEDEWLTAEKAQRQQAGDARQRARAFTVEPPSSRSMSTWLLAPAQDPESPTVLGRAQVRDGGDSIEVIVLQRDSDGVLRLPGGPGPLAGHLVPEGSMPLDDWRLTRAMAATTVALPMQMCASPAQTEATIAALERAFAYDTWQASPWLAGQLALELDADGSACVAGFDLTYSPQLGLTATRRRDAA